MKIIILISIYLLSISTVISQHFIDKDLQKQIKSNIIINKSLDSLRLVFINYINKTRSNPEYYGIINNLEVERLDTIKPNTYYIFNTILNKKAQEYASKLSFIKYNGIAYLNHSSMEYSESLVMCTSLSNGFYNLILDSGIPTKGHRKHMLISTDTQIGIGICYIESLGFYIIVIETDI